MMNWMRFETILTYLLLMVCSTICSDGYHRAKAFYWSRAQGSTPFSYRGSQIGPLPAVNQVMREWASWGSWKECSRSCGKGVRSRTRTCISKTPSVMPGTGIRTTHNRCHGDSIQYDLCSIKTCGPSEGSSSAFRAAQCRKYNNRKVLGRLVANWIPFGQGGMNPCALVCEGEGEGIVYTFGKVVDGTDCRTDNKSKGLCVNGRCMRLSCDGRLGGMASEDMCLVCGGHNETCTRHTGVYHSELPSADQPYPGIIQKIQKSKKSFGYYEVAKIPRGSTHVKVFDNSSNFLALKSLDKYLLNGDWLIDWPGEVDAAGTTFTYLRSEDQSESLTSLGPTNENIVLMILLREHNPGVYYEYWTPTSPSKSFNRYYLDSPTWKQSPRITATTTSTTLQSTSKPSVVTSTSMNRDINNTNHIVSLPVPAALKAAISESTKRNVDSSKKRSKHKSRNDVSVTKAWKKDKRKRPKYCEDCSGRRKTKESFCTSDFVSKVRVVSRDRIGDFYRIEVLVDKSYKNTVPLSHKEFIWQHRCSCRFLRPLRTYVVMGITEKVKDREVKLVLRPSSFVRKFTEKTHGRVLRIRQQEMKKCRKWRKDKVHHKKLLKKFFRNHNKHRWNEV